MSVRLGTVACRKDTKTCIKSFFVSCTKQKSHNGGRTGDSFQITEKVACLNIVY